MNTEQIQNSKIPPNLPIFPDIPNAILSNGTQNTQKGDSNIQLNEDGEKVYPPAKLSLFQQKKMANALKKHRNDITQPQICMNREFQGDSFIAKPNVIEFKDFEIGEPHILNVRLTNVSNTFCSFRILEIEDEYRDYFEVEYERKGRMSAGISARVRIRFMSDVAKDINTHLPVLAQTGLINIPIVCTYKKAIVRLGDDSLLIPYEKRRIEENVNRGDLSEEEINSLSSHFEKNIIDFGNVIFGESGTVELILKNEGALQTLYYVKNSRGELMRDKTETMSMYSSKYSQISKNSDKDETDLNEDDYLLKQLYFSKSGKIEGYSTIKIPIIYKPKEIGNWETTITIHFENFIHSPPINVKIKGNCVDLPIYVEKEMYDMEICLLNNTYREQLVFHNRGKKPMKIQLVLPMEIKKFASLNPSFGYIQPESPFKIWFKLEIQPQFYSMCKKYEVDNGEYIIPLQLIGSEQQLPVDFKLRVRITINRITANPNYINFGLLYENTAKKIPVILENKSDLSQEIHFYPLPSNISIDPEMIPLSILPNEKLTVEFIYRGNEIKCEEGIIIGKIVTGTIAVKQIKLGYKAEVYKCPLKFNPLKIEFPSLQIGESNNHILNIRNFSAKDYECEFFLPFFQICGFKLTPMWFKLKRGKSIEIKMEYHSEMRKLGAFTMKKLEEIYKNDYERNFDAKLRQLEQQKLQIIDEDEEQQTEKIDLKKKKKDIKKPVSKKKSKKDQEAEEEERLKQEELERKRLKEELERMRKIEEDFDMTQALAELGGKFWEFNQGKLKSQHYKWLIPCFFKPLNEPETSRSSVYLEVNTVTTSKVLIADRNEINFGEIAVGFRKVEEILITNIGDKTADLRMDLLPLFGGFNVLNALRSIPPGKTRNIVIQFEPHNEQAFKEKLRIYCKESSISINLKGRSVKPEIQIQPENGILDISSCLINEYITKTFVVKNISNFALDFKLITMVTGIKNSNGKEAFLFNPSQGKISASEELEIEVTFCPDRISEKYWSLIKIDIPNQRNEKQIYLYGSCYPRQAYISYWNKILARPTVEQLSKIVENPLDFIRIADSEHIIGFQVKNMTVKFDKEIEGIDEQNNCCYEHKIIIGACKMVDPKLEKSVNYEVVLYKDQNSEFFECSQPKGNVSSGNELEILFKFKPPEIDPFIANIEAFKGIGQWVEVKGEIKLSGGYIPSNETNEISIQDQIVINLSLKAYIRKI